MDDSRIISGKQLSGIIIVAIGSLLVVSLIVKAPSELFVLAVLLGLLFIGISFRNITIGYLMIIFFFCSRVLEYIPSSPGKGGLLTPLFFMEAVLLGLFITYVLVNRIKFLPLRYQTIAMLSFFTISLASAFLTGWFSMMIFKAIFVLIFVYLLTSYLVSNFMIAHNVFRVLALSGIALSVGVLLQFKELKLQRLYTVEGLRTGSVGLIDPNELAVFLVMFIPTVVYLVIYEKHWFWRIISYVSLPLFLAGMVVGISRTGFIALIVCSIFIFIYFKNKKITIYFTVILIVFFVTTPIIYWDRIGTILTDPTYGGRQGIFESAIELIKEDPFTGKGFGSFSEEMYLRSLQEYSAHNMYINIIAESGLFMLFLYMSIFGKTVYDIRALSKKLCNPEKTFLKSIEITIYIFFIGALTLDTKLRIPIYIYIGLVMAMHKYFFESVNKKSLK